MKTMGLFVKLHRQSCKLILCLNLVVSFKIFNDMATARFTWHLAMLILNVRWYEHLPGRFPNTKCQNLQQTQNWTLWNGSDSNQDLSIHCHNVWFLIPLLFRLYHLDFELASWKTINGNVGGIFTEPDYVWGSSCRVQEKFFALQSILTPKDTGQIICIFSLREFSCVKKYFRDLVNRVFSPSIGAILAISFTS